jgi:type IV pilus assembly protein PilQ
MLAVLVMAGSAPADPATTTGAENVITRLDIYQEQQTTRVVLRGTRTPNFTVFRLKNPERLVVDLIHTEVQGVDAPRIVDDGRIGRIATARFRQAGSTVSRFIIGLKPKVRFRAKAEGSAVVVTISGRDAVAKPEAAVAPPPTAPPPVKKADSVQMPEKSEQDYRVVESRGDRDKPGKVTIRRIVTTDAAVTVLTNRPIRAYEVLEVFEPFRLVLDVYGASMRVKKHDRKLSGKRVERLRVGQHRGKVRVVLDCADGRRQPYKIERLKKGIRVRFEKQVATPKPKPKATRPKPTPRAAPKAKPRLALAPRAAESAALEALREPPPKPSTLKELNFRQDEKVARVILDLDGSAVPQVVHTDHRSAVLEIPHCKLPLILERTLDTSEFGGAISSLSAYRVRGEDKVKLVAVTQKRINSRLERKEGRLHWVFETGAAQAAAPATAKDAVRSVTYTYQPDQVAGYSVRRPDFQSSVGGGKKKKRRYTGKRISLDFKDADIHNILRLISEVSKLNVITSDDVSGKITVTMRNVPWDQALDIILKTKKLGKVRHGNIIRVAPLTTLVEEQELAAKAAEARKSLEPLRVRLIPVNYAVASDVQSQVKDVLSERGTVSVDKRTNVLIVKDVLENLIKAEGLVRSLDAETPQVLIEARIVEANTQFVREVGVQWGGDLSFSAATGNPTGLPFPSQINMQGGADDSKTSTDMSGTANPGQFAVNLPAAVGAGSGGALGFIFGSAGGAAHLNLRLSALENRGAVKILSAPKIATLDNHKARIGQGVSIPISVVSAAGVNTMFVEAKLELEVTPHITQEGSVLMEIKVRKNEPDFSRTGARGDPSILKKEAETQVLVRDGDTTVIGGIYTKKTSDTFTGVPVLSRIPVLGWFFRNSKKNDERTELLIFITPRIVNRMRSTVTQR